MYLLLNLKLYSYVDYSMHDKESAVNELQLYKTIVHIIYIIMWLCIFIHTILTELPLLSGQSLTV